MSKLRLSLIALGFFIAFKISYSQTAVQAPSTESLNPKDSTPKMEVRKEKPKTKNKFYKSPGKAMLLSTIFPGAGQFYTENYLKGAIITCAWGTLGYLSIREHLRAREALSQNNNYDYIEHRNQRNIFLWWTAAVWVFSIADAYVSSYMYKFKEQESLSLFSNAMNLGLKFTPQLSLCFEMKLREF